MKEDLRFNSDTQSESQTSTNAEFDFIAKLEETEKSKEQKTERPYGFNTWTTEEKQEWAKEELSRLEQQNSPELQSLETTEPQIEHLDPGTIKEMMGLYDDAIKGEEPKTEPITETSAPVPTPETPKEEVSEKIQPSEWNKLNDILFDLGIDLEFNEEHLKKFEEANPIGLEEKSREIAEAIDSFPNKENLKEKFSKIKLGYPKYEEASQVFIEEDTLFIDLGIDKQKIIDFLNSLQTAPVSESLPEVNLVPQEKQFSDWRESEEWKKFEAMREDLARYEVPIAQAEMSSIGLELKRSEYFDCKNAIAKKIEESFRKNAGENLTPEKETELKSIINDAIFRELVMTENAAYKKVLKEHRTETLGDKVKETLKVGRNTKAMQWYLGLPKGQRFAINTVLGTAMGIAFGAATSVGVATYGAMRFSRAGASFLGSGIGTEIGEEKWSVSVKEINEREQKETEALKNSGKSFEEKSRQFDEIKNRYEKERRKIGYKKAALAIGMGAGAGALTGLAEHIFTNGTEAVPINENSAKSGAADNFQEVKPKVSEHLIQKPEAGSSLWSNLDKTLDSNPKYVALNPVQRQYVVSYFTNKALDNPDDFGFPPDPDYGIRVEVGKEIDFSRLMNDPDEFERVVTKAANLTEAQQINIKANSEAIARWIEDHPETKYTNDQVAEILSSKPKVEVPSEPIIEPKTEVLPFAEVEGSLENKTPPTEVISANPTEVPNAPVVSNAQDFAAQDAAYVNGLNSTKVPYNPQNFGWKNPDYKNFMTGDLLDKVTNGIKDEVDHFYHGRGGFLGLKRISGIDSEDWKFIKALDAKKVFDYYYDPTSVDLPKKVIAELVNSKHRTFAEHLFNLRQNTGIDFEPRTNENIEAFYKRLGGFLIKNQK